MWSIAATLAGVVGVIALARGAVPQSAATGGATNNSPPIVVTGAYVREPASPTIAAAYFTVFNTTGTPDLLQTVSSGAGASTVLHATTNGVMTVVNGSVVIPAHGKVVFTPDGGHVMIQQLYGTLKPGQIVDLELDFQNAGPVIVEAPVIGIYAPAPTGTAATTSPSPTSSGVK